MMSHQTTTHSLANMVDKLAKGELSHDELSPEDLSEIEQLEILLKQILKGRKISEAIKQLEQLGMQLHQEVKDSPSSTLIGMLLGDYHVHQYAQPIATRDIEEVVKHYLGIIDRNEELDFERHLALLNYNTQGKRFKTSCKNRIQAYFIYGKRGYGQRWLLGNLLCTQSHIRPSDRFIQVSFGRQDSQNGMRDLWSDIGRRFGKADAERKDIIEAVFENLEKENIVIILNNLQTLPPKILNNLLTEIWFPIVKYGANLPTKWETRLYIFFIDLNGSTANWCQTIEAWEPQEDSYLPPVQLPITRFERIELSKWFNDIRQELPPGWDWDNEDDLIEELFQNSDDGVPEYMLEAICDEYGFEYVHKKNLQKRLKI